VSEETVTLELLATPDAAVAGLGDPRDFAWWPRLTRRIAQASVSPVQRWHETLNTAADVVAAADALPLVYPGVGARLLLGDAALAGGELRQAHQASEWALRTSVQPGYRLRAADALDGLATLAMAVDDLRSAHRATGLAAAIRARCGEHPWPRPSLPDRPTVGDDPPHAWLVDGLPTAAAIEAVSAPLAPPIGSPLDGGAWSRLTRRERDVAELAVRGASNGEIADALFVSRRRVECHLQRVYRKLDLHLRAELADALRPHVGRGDGVGEPQPR
jgi:DNA-binding CsgD family transcriptional regulator